MACEKDFSFRPVQVAGMSWGLSGDADGLSLTLSGASPSALVGLVSDIASLVTLSPRY